MAYRRAVHRRDGFNDDNDNEAAPTAYDTWLESAVGSEAASRVRRSRFVNSRLDGPSSRRVAAAADAAARKRRSPVSIDGIGDLSSSSPSESEDEGDDDDDDDDGAFNSPRDPVDLTGDALAFADDGSTAAASCCRKFESVLIWAFVVAFIVVAFYGAMQHNFFRVFFSRGHPVRQFVRDYHRTISRVFPFGKYGYVMFAYRQPALFEFTGFHVLPSQVGAWVCGWNGGGHSSFVRSFVFWSVFQLGQAVLL